MEARTYIVPVVQLASRIAPWLFVAGLMLQMQSGHVGWGDSVRFVVPICVPHLAG